MKTALGELPGDDPSNRLEVSCDTTSDVVPETRVLVSRRLEDKNESLGLGLGHEHLVLVLVSVLKKKSLAVFQDFCYNS